MNDWFIDILYLVRIMAELWQWLSCFEYLARSNTLNAESSECSKYFSAFEMELKYIKKLAKKVVLLIHQLLKGVT